MPSPFVGMDPFLEEERLWPWFQHQLAITLERMLSAGVGTSERRLSAGVGDRYGVHLSERRFRAGHQDYCAEYIAIHAKADGRQVTLLDIVSPADKLTEAGRAASGDFRRAARDAGANVVEIDLVLQGEPLFVYSHEGLPHWDYAVTVTREMNPERYEIYTSMLEKHLPRFCLPMASDDRDTVVNLQEAFSQTYNDCAFDDEIDYRKDPEVPLNAGVLGRVADILRERRG
jgi:Protein of unknown function (DUF4058)